MSRLVVFFAEPKAIAQLKPSVKDNIVMGTNSDPNDAPLETSKKTNMAPKKSYEDEIKEQFHDIFDKLDLTELQKRYLKTRWLEQMLWLESRAGQAKKLYYRLRLTTIVGGVLIPALVSSSINLTSDAKLKNTIGTATFLLSQVVAVTAAVDQFFNYGEQWRHYRRTVEFLKTQCWQFLELAGPYEGYTNHQTAFPSFARRVEEVIPRDLEIFPTQTVQSKKQGDGSEAEQSQIAGSQPGADRTS